MLSFKTAILYLLTLACSVKVTHAAVCNLQNGLVGRDSGIAVFAAFEYNLTVKATITPAVVESSILPSLEKSFATRASKALIKACAPPGQVVINDIVGFDVDPPDYVVGRCGPGKGNCFAIHSETTIFVASTGKDTAAVYRNTLKVLFRNKTFVPINSNIVSMTGFRAVEADLANTDPSDTSNPNAFVKVLKMPSDDPVIFWVLIVATVVLSITALYLSVVCCCPYDSNGNRQCILKKC